MSINPIRVPNEYRKDVSILLIGEAPGASEEEQLIPFAGDSGKLLWDTLARYGISREQTSVANLCQYRPSDNKFENLLNSRELRDGCEELKAHIQSKQYNVIVALGGHALEFISGYKGITRYRGSILTTRFNCNVPVARQKVIPTLHPSAVLRDPNSLMTFSMDLARIVNDSKFASTNYTKRDYYIDPTLTQYKEWVDIIKKAPVIAIDIESVRSTKDIICIGFATSEKMAYVFPFNMETYLYIKEILEYEANEKVFHYGIYDTTVLQLNGIRVSNYTFDTHIAAHIIEPEFERTLAFLTSIYTREPYYKSEGRGTLPNDSKAWSDNNDKHTTYIYNAKDCCCTFEIYIAQLARLHKTKQYEFFQYEFSLLPVARHIGSSGMPVDMERLDLLKRNLFYQWGRAQFFLNNLAGKDINVNVRSPKLKAFLYSELGLPERKHKGKVTTNADAIINLIGFAKGKVEDVVKQETKLKWERSLAICELILEIRGVRQLISNYILVDKSTDNRIRSIYTVSATETGRWAASGFVDGTGLNTQTFPRGSVKIIENPDIDAAKELMSQFSAFDVSLDMEDEEE